MIGGYALAVHGRPRYTKDIDIWLELSSENAERVVKALNDFGFASLGLSQADFIEKDQMIQLGYPPNRIDLLTAADGVEFRNCYENRVKIEIDGVMINFIDLENLKANKRATGRLQDLADLEALQNVGNIDDSQAT